MPTFCAHMIVSNLIDNSKFGGSFRSENFGGSFRCESMLKPMRKEHSVPYPGRPPLQLLVDQENLVLCETKPKTKNVLMYRL